MRRILVPGVVALIVLSATTLAWGYCAAMRAAASRPRSITPYEAYQMEMQRQQALMMMINQARAARKDMIRQNAMALSQNRSMKAQSDAAASARSRVQSLNNQLRTMSGDADRRAQIAENWYSQGKMLQRSGKYRDASEDYYLYAIEAAPGSSAAIKSRQALDDLYAARTHDHVFRGNTKTSLSNRSDSNVGSRTMKSSSPISGSRAMTSP